MKRAILVLFLLGFVSLNGYSQRVYKQGGKVYLDCTAKSKMPAGAVTTIPKCVEGAASNTALRNGATSGDNPYASENDKVFQLLEIDNVDYSAAINWAAGYNGCKSKNTGGVTGWRLPTQRELMLMSIFCTPLGQLTGSPFANAHYWSSFEGLQNDCWFVNVSNGYTDGNKKITGCRVRCVREVMP